jgi:hypothetical protein
MGREAPFGGGAFGDAPFGPSPPDDTTNNCKLLLNDGVSFFLLNDAVSVIVLNDDSCVPESDGAARAGLHPISCGFAGTKVVSMLHPIEHGISA